MAQPNRQPKAMSSRLATMKFMQRASASPSSSPSTPTEPPSKKQRLSTGSYNSTPSSAPRSDSQAVQEALAAEEQKRTAALERQAADRGESKWYLSFKEPQTSATESPLLVVSAGYSMLDAASTAKERSSEEEGTEATRPSIAGRRSFGKFNKVVEKQQNPDLSSDSASDDSESDSDAEDEDDDDDNDPTGAKALITQSRKEAGEAARKERRTKRKADKAEALRLADERRKKHVKLNQLTSISGNTGGSPNTKEITCHSCGKKGHIQRDCPQPSQQQQRSRRR
ncbi:hypothetical protein LTR36_006918 [Oleoguttula mirabilis]|uniref:CCHC-type domain-containing protein n=1 Tax=Oleoguttula mirabilis TaxID=1507867 RepID=A0AAV9JAU1_9PEZI|nr:hypothetical protein LTR36_006918 [Oleoguttula mirabilis]